MRDAGELARYLAGLERRMTISARNFLDSRYRRIEDLMGRQVFRQPKLMLAQRQQGADMLRERLIAAAASEIKNRRQRISHLIDKLELVNPAGVLRRGYGLVQRQDGTVVSSIGKVSVDDVVKIRVADGSLEACVTQIEEV